MICIQNIFLARSKKSAYKGNTVYVSKKGKKGINLRTRLKWTGTAILPAEMLKQFITKEKNCRRQLKLQLHENNTQRTLIDCYYNLITSIMPENNIEG